MKYGLLIAAAAALPMVAQAACPNSCSGHGVCGANDQCTCYQGFRGNNCGERTCPYGKAWVTTPRGDLNYNGDLYDATVYDQATAFTTRDYVVSDDSLGGAWEFWPGNAQSGEGHFLMECSNAGLCNKETGQCECFAGFEGHACNRASCPGGNDCNGHGRCMTVEEMIADASSAYTYSLWDYDMARACRCDPGYSGPGCTDRLCPKGDDPLTKTHQTDDVQTFRIWSTLTTASTQDALGGTFTITVTDHFGNKATTDAIAISRYDGTNGATLQDAVQDALEALPNKIVPSVEVTVGYCEETIPGEYDDGFTASGAAIALATTGKYYRCPDLTISSGTVCKDVIYDDAGTEWVGTCVKTTFDAVVSGCTQITYPRCNQYILKFTDVRNAGDFPEITIDDSSVTVGGVSSSMSLGGSTIDPDINSDVSKERAITQAASSFDIILASGTTATAGETNSDVTYTSGTKTFFLGTDTAGTPVLPAGAKIQVECSPDAGTTFYDMGEYTVATTVTWADSASLVLSEAVQDPKSRCTTSATLEVRVTLKTNYLISNTDLSNISPALSSLGAGLIVGDTAVASAVSSLVTYDATNHVQYVLLENAPAAAAASKTVMKIAGTGTKEYAECSTRGNCDYTTGLCKCFKGYTGEACQNQNALWTAGES